MSSGIKRGAFGRQCVIAELHVGDRPRDDWTAIQESDGCWSKWRLIMQYVWLVKRLVVSEGQEELTTTKATTCC
jgi:hypothetical protein